MIENQENNIPAGRPKDAEDPVSADVSDEIDFSDLESNSGDFYDETIDFSMLESNEAEEEEAIIDLSDLEADEDEDEEVIDFTEITTMTMVEGDTILELTDVFRLNGSERDDALERDDVLELDEALEEDAFFDPEAASKGELLLELTEEEYDIEEEEFDIEDSEFMDETDAPALQDLKDDTGDEDLEEELLGKLDDYFGEEEDEEDFQPMAAKSEPGVAAGATGDVALAPGQLEAALDRLIEKKFGAMIDDILSDAVTRKISDEIDAIKAIVLDSIKSRK